LELPFPVNLSQLLKSDKIYCSSPKNIAVQQQGLCPEARDLYLFEIGIYTRDVEDSNKARLTCNQIRFVPFVFLSCFHLIMPSVLYPSSTLCQQTNFPI
jgi:hypothetical protein